MKKKLMILFFVLVLAISAFSMTAHAVVEISAIGIQNLLAPLAGNTPDYNIDYINGGLVSKQYVDGYSPINGIVWYELKQVNAGSKPIELQMSKKDTFELGKKYRVRIFVMPNNSNTVFANSVTAKLYEMNSDVEGMSAKTGTVFTPTGNSNSDYKVVTADYECTKAAIETVEVTGLKLPGPGEVPDDDCNVLTDGVYVNNAGGKVEWYYNGVKMDPATDKFEAGKTYKLSLWLRTDFVNGYRFKTDSSGDNVAEVIINGIPFEVCDTDEYDYVRGVEYDFYVPYNTLSNIDVVGISAPIAGKEPDYEAAPTTTGYDITEIFWIDETLKDTLIADGKTYVEAINQSKLTKGDGKTFKAGHSYKVCIGAKPHTNYEIDYDPMDYDVLYYNATVNGNDADEGSGYRGEDASFSYVFGLPALQTITYIDITGVDAPVAGRVPDYDAVCGSDTYTLKNLFWVDETTKADLIAGGKTYVEAVNQSKLIKSDGKTFTAGHKYTANFEVEPAENYEIDYNTLDYNVLYFAATVNGEDAKEGSGYRGENAGFSYTFKHTCAFNLIAKVEATCTDKGKNAYYMCSCGKITKDAVGNKPIADIDTWGIIPVDASNHTGGTANCTDKAKCTRCGEAYSSVNAKNHKSLTALKAVAATCTKAGKTEGKKCTACGVTTVAQKAVAKKAHTITTLKAVAATCTAAGKTEGKKCSVCGTVTVAQKTVAAKGHTYKTTTTKATLTKNGKAVTKCTACGKVSKTAVIYYPKTIKLSKTAYTYNGKVQTPTVTVKDSKGNTLKKDTDYTVTYEKGRKSTGKYTVTVTFKGKYSGKKALTYTIAPKATGKVTAVQSTKAIKLTWNKVTGADGYRVYQYNSKTKKWDSIKTLTGTSYKVEKLKAGTIYKFRIKAYKKDDGTIWGAAKDITTATKPATPKITKLTATKGKAALVWSDVSGEKGYEVYASTKKDSGFKKVAVTKTDVTKTTVSKLTSGKTYYFKVRAYKTVGDAKVYSAWSAVKGAKVK